MKISPSDPWEPLLHTPRTGMICRRHQFVGMCFGRGAPPSHGLPAAQASINPAVKAIIPRTRGNTVTLSYLLGSPQGPKVTVHLPKNRISRPIARFMEWKLFYQNLRWKPPHRAWYRRPARGLVA